jgi:hypothetical protein
MLFSGFLRYTKNKMMSYLDPANFLLQRLLKVYEQLFIKCSVWRRSVDDGRGAKVSVHLNLVSHYLPRRRFSQVE